MADDQQDVQRAAVREWYRGEQARLAEISDAEWAERRDAEMLFVRDWAAQRRRSAA
jgi:hypothetical protein